jgi:hypothetical protein
MPITPKGDQLLRGGKDQELTLPFIQEKDKNSEASSTSFQIFFLIRPHYITKIFLQITMATTWDELLERNK